MCVHQKINRLKKHIINQQKFAAYKINLRSVPRSLFKSSFHERIKHSPKMTKGLFPLISHGINKRIILNSGLVLSINESSLKEETTIPGLLLYIQIILQLRSSVHSQRTRPSRKQDIISENCQNGQQKQVHKDFRY